MLLLAKDTVALEWLLKNNVLGADSIFDGFIGDKNIFIFKEVSHIKVVKKILPFPSPISSVIFWQCSGVVDVKLHTDGIGLIFLKSIKFSICIKLNFFLANFLSLSDLSLGGYNRNKTRPRRPRIKLQRHSPKLGIELGYLKFRRGPI